MNCFEYRKLVLTDPRVRTPEQERHVAECAACAGFLRDSAGFEARLHDAIDVPAPEALAERVLLRRKFRRSGMRAWALAASVLVAFGLGYFLRELPVHEGERVLRGDAVGGSHAAVSAIVYVIEYEPKLLQEGRTGDPAALRRAIDRLEMRIPAGASVRYLGPCPVPGGTGEHVVLDTAKGKSTLILTPDQGFASRVVVSHRDQVAIAAPRRSGGYVLVGGELERLKRLEAELLL
jgi:hypothetical protein